MADAPVAGGVASAIPQGAPGSSAHGPVLREHGYHSLGVRAVIDETSDARSFVLDIPPELTETFRYRPGQFCTFRVRVDGEEHFRSYSMSSEPDMDADLVVTVKRVPGGLVSNWLNDNVPTGATVELTKPAGVFCPQETERPLVAFCGGSGITPVMSITKCVLATTGRTVRLLYANRDADSVIFDSGLRELEADHGERLQLQLHHDNDGGFLVSDDIRTFAAITPDADFYICGPGPFMDLVEQSLHDLGVDPERIFIERFLVGDEFGESLGTDSATEPMTASDGAATPENVTVILNGKPSVVSYHSGDTLLDTARRGGLRPPFSCEAGNCATCMAFLREGSVRMRTNNALTPDEVEEGWVLTCQSLPTSPVVTVEYEAM